MKAKELRDILNFAPEAEVRFETISDPNVFATTNYRLEKVYGYRVIKDKNGNITSIILSQFEIQPYPLLF